MIFVNHLDYLDFYCLKKEIIIFFSRLDYSVSLSSVTSLEIFVFSVSSAFGFGLTSITLLLELNVTNFSFFSLLAGFDLALVSTIEEVLASKSSVLVACNSFCSSLILFRSLRPKMRRQSFLAPKKTRMATKPIMIS